MLFIEAIRLALNTIRAQKLKSFFTLLGVCIGVMFLIAVVSIVEGMGRYMEKDLIGKLIGVNSFELRHRPNINMGDMDPSVWEEYRRRPRLYHDDVRPVVDALPAGTRWAVVSDNTLPISSRYSGGPRNAQISAVEGDYFAIRRFVIVEGREFTPQELEMGTPVVIIGQDVVKRLFPGLSAVGRELRMGGLPYTVVGVLESQGSAIGISFDNQVFAPWQSPVHRLLNRVPQIIDAVIVQVPTASQMTEAQERVRQVMRTRHKLRPAQPDNFSVQTAESALEFWNKIKRYLVLAGIALPAIGLVVGAIVIMNIMLVAVAERTREIGIRKALGARRADILTQFLIEAATLSTVGAALGVALGIGLAKLISAVSPLPATVAPWSVAVGVALGAGVGIISGVYPASRASMLDPIAALRQE
ncbi:MAG: ABC transporter permease [Gemmatimonadota bacterium]|nr:ABC transporter permease [Gemmatimonadota bacterium]